MLLVVEKGITGEICHSIYRYPKANNKYMNYHDQNKESSRLQYWDINNLYGWAMSQKLPVNNFDWIEDTSQFNEDFKITITKKIMKNIFLLRFSILKNYMTFTMIYPFCQKE